MSRTSQDQHEVGVFDNHCFFWRTELSQERMTQISEWIGALSAEQRKLLDDLLKDFRDEMEWKLGDWDR